MEGRQGTRARTRAARAVVGALLVLAFTAAPAWADQEIVAGAGSQYLTTQVTMDQGEPLTFRNLDLTGHDVRSKGKGADGRPLFLTPILPAGGSHFVEGSQYLTTGSYDFFCSIHPFMTGTLTVTGAGKPDKRPGGGDSRAPGVSVQITSPSLKKIADSGKLSVSFYTDEAATVKLSGNMRVGKKSYALGTATRQVQRQKPTKVALKLGTKAKEAAKKASKATFNVKATTRDSAGNTGSGGVKRKYQR